MQISPITSTPPAADPVQLSERMNRMSPVEQRRVVAQQFEAILLRQLLAPALQSMPGAGNGVYSYMLTDAFAQKLSTGSGLGLAAVLERQLTPRSETKSAAPASSLSSSGQTSATLVP
jgi:Rod binding domain-containing protein